MANDSTTEEMLFGPDRVHRNQMITAPDGLALEYNKALANVLSLLSDEELAKVSVNLQNKINNRPSHSSPDSLNLSSSKVESEAAERWNNRRGGNKWLYCILRGELFLPD